MTVLTYATAREPRRALEHRLEIAVWAVTLGLASGVACVAVRLTFRILQWLLVQHAGLLPQAAAMLSPGQRVLTPIVGAAAAIAVLWAANRWGHQGRFEEYLEAIRHGEGEMSFTSTLWRTVSSALSVATGAAIGREGSMIQFATAVTSWVGRHSPFRSIPLRKQVCYGVAAAVAAAYQAPVAGLVFAIEIVLEKWDWSEIPALALASVSGWMASRLMLGAGPLFAVHEKLQLDARALWAIPLALVLGCFGPLYLRLLRSFNFVGRWPAALLWSGLAVGLLSMLRPEVWGNGDAGLIENLAGTTALGSVVVLLLLRLIATTVCVGAGTAGGVFTPTLFAGASIGVSTGLLLHMSQPELLAIVGMSALLAAATHAPVMASLMAIELTGQFRLLPLLLALNLGAWLVARRISPLSLYGSSLRASEPKS
jgi:CIC family chloride channel protein